MSLAQTLATGAAEWGLVLPAQVQAQLLAYLALLEKWNKTYNLTAIRDVESMLTHHILDALSVQPFLPNTGALADIGSGAGLPGIVLALVAPSLQVTSIEPVHKKASFQQQVKIELGLPNLNVCCARAQEVKGAFDVVISRAFASLADFVSASEHLLAPQGRWWAMKGRWPDDEIRALPATTRVSATYPLRVPGLNAERHLIILERQ